MEEETEEHLFFTCPYAKKIWRASGIDNTIIDSLTTSLEEKLEACLQVSNVATLNHHHDLPIWFFFFFLENLEEKKYVIISASTVQLEECFD